jgi:hypothetical protein
MGSNLPAPAFRSRDNNVMKISKALRQEPSKRTMITIEETAMSYDGAHNERDAF